MYLVRPLSLILLCVAVCFPHSGRAQTATQSGRAEVGVVTPLSFIQTEDLHFGQIFASNTAGTVTVAPDGTRTRTGGVTLFGNSQQAAEFAGMGSFNQRVQISLGSNSIFLTGPGVRMRARLYNRQYTYGSFDDHPAGIPYRWPDRGVSLPRRRDTGCQRQSGPGHLYRHLDDHAQLSVVKWPVAARQRLC